MKKFFNEFREFIARGHVMDMAVGVIIGGAFTAIANSLAKNIITPIIKLLAGGQSGFSMVIPVPGSDTGIDFGAFISSILQFLFIAFVVFCMIKALNKINDAGSALLKKDTTKKETPVCPYCLEEIKDGATKCPHCGSKITKDK